MVSKKSERVILLYLPLLCQVTSLFNSVFFRLGIHRFYLLVYVIAFFGLLLLKNHDRKYNRVSPIIYIISLVLITLIHLLLNSAPSILLFSGFLTYLLPILYWSAYLNKDRGYVYLIFHYLKLPYAIIAILAVIQYFFSPDLFGLFIADEGYLKWASDSDFDSYSVFFRASSLLGSPQILGLNMALFIVVFLKYIMNNRRPFDYFLLVCYLIAGILSGSKSFFFVVGVYMIFAVFLAKTKLTTKIIAALIVASALLILNYFSDVLGFLGRISDVQTIAEGEKGGRLERYSFVLANASFIGEGPGTAQAISGFTRNIDALESYLFQMLYELGIIPFIFFLAVIISGFLKSKCKIIIALIAFSMVYVHAFNSFVFFIFWSFLLLPDITIGTGDKKINYK